MDHHDILAWGATTANTMPTTGEDDIPADIDEPPDVLFQHKGDFHRSTIKLNLDRNESLLTRALTETTKSDSEVANDILRRRSLLSTTSAASTVDLTSDGGLTSPARTNTPSPPCPPASYMSFAPYAFETKPSQTTGPAIIKLDPKDPEVVQTPLPSSTALPKPDPAVVALVKKRCISFACGAQKPKSPTPVAMAVAPEPSAASKPAAKRCMIKFACPGPRAAEKPQLIEEAPLPIAPVKLVTPTKTLESNRRRHSRSPSLTRKPRPTPPLFARFQTRDSSAHKESSSPSAIRSRKPKYIAVNEDSLLSSEATRFHEFASDEPQEDDWIRKDVSETKKKLTINDTLEKENAIRRLGKEAEEEALQDEEDEDEDEDVGIDSDDEIEEEEDDDVDNIDLDDQDEDDATVEGSDIDASDGNETDNEAGFADSDDESDAAGDYQFWTPGRSIFNSKSDDLSMIRPTGHRAASESSIDSLKHMSPIADALAGSGRRKARSRRIKIRPGTPDLPDSTDFVCGTLDEDRPLEDAYVSCMEARKREKHFLIPQDIDPSFPTSDPEDAEENDEEDINYDSDEHVWLHGQFEDSDDDNVRRRRRSIRSPGHSPKRLHSPPPHKRLHSPPPHKRLHSPPPAKHRHRSPPPPRRLFGGHSPNRLRSPPPARHVRSPPASPTANIAGVPISFAPLGQRPGLTHTKSLPRTPNAFCKQYRESRLAALSRGTESSDTADPHTRGAIDIVKGLEQKRQRRKEKFYQKHCNRARKVGQPERKPQPGKGAERMRELGLQMAGKLENRTGRAEFVLSI